MALTADQLTRLSNYELNLGVNNLQDAVLEGVSKYGMIDGFTDVFADETGVDTGASANETYDATDDYYRQTPTGNHGVLIQSGTTDGSTTFRDSNGVMDVVSGGATSPTHEDDVTDAFGGSRTSLYFADSANQRLNVGGIGESEFDFGAGSWTIKFWMRSQNLSSTPTIIGLYGASGDRAWNIEGLGTGAVRLNYSTDGSAGIQVSSNTSVVSDNTWAWVVVTHDGSKTRFYVNGGYVGGGARTDTINYNNTSEKLTIGARPNATQVYQGHLDDISITKGTAEVTTEVGGTDGDITTPTAPYSDALNEMTLISNSETALDTPTNARAVLVHTPSQSTTLNTDAVLSVSRDGGTTYTAFTLTKKSDYGTIDGQTAEILTSDDLDISGQPSGTSMVYKLVTANGKSQRLNGVYLQWRTAA